MFLNGLSRLGRIIFHINCCITCSIITHTAIGEPSQICHVSGRCAGLQPQLGARYRKRCRGPPRRVLEWKRRVLSQGTGETFDVKASLCCPTGKEPSSSDFAGFTHENINIIKHQSKARMDTSPVPRHSTPLLGVSSLDFAHERHPT